MASKMHTKSNSQSFIAASDLSDKKNRFVKFHTVLGEVEIISSAVDIPCGVLMNAPLEGQPAEVALPGGGAQLLVDASIVNGSFITTGADGKGELATGTSGKYISARADAISDAGTSSDDVIPVIVVAFEAAREAQDIMTTEGDVIQGGGSGVPERLGIGTNRQRLSSNGTKALWVSPVITTEGDVMQGGTSGVEERLAIGGAGEILTSNGTKSSWAASAYAEKAATLTISRAQLLALNGATGGDLEMVAAQVGVIYVPTTIQVFCDYDTAEYANGDDCVLFLGTVAAGTLIANIDKSAFIPGTTADSHDFMSMPDTALWASSATTVGIAITGLENKALVFNVKSGGTQFTDPGTAVGVFQVKVTYREVALLTP